jgi:hypothetical protein
MCPSKVQFIRSTIRSRSSRPSAFSASLAALMERGGTAPYIEHSVIGKAST